MSKSNDRDAGPAPRRSPLVGFLSTREQAETSAHNRKPAERIDESTIAPDPLPSKIGRFQVRRLVGRGGFGRVYEAWDPRLERLVALKILDVDGEVCEELLREARHVAKVRKPGICPIYEVEPEGAPPYLVLGWLEGGTLARKQAESPLGTWEALDTVRRIALAMEHVHQNGLVHRDLKPANILLDASGLPYVSDFGLTCPRTGVATESVGANHIVGTPAYMSPEQASGNASSVTGATDIFSLGVILYELVTGQRPFRGANVKDCLQQVMFLEPPAPSTVCPTLPESIDVVIRKAMAKEAANRYSSMYEFATAISRILESYSGDVAYSTESSFAKSTQPHSPVKSNARALHPRNGIWIAGAVFGLLIALAGIHFGISMLSTGTPNSQSGNASAPPTVESVAPNDSGTEKVIEAQSKLAEQSPIAPASADQMPVLDQDSLHRNAAEAVLNLQGEIQIVGHDGPIATVAQLPNEQFRIRAIKLWTDSITADDIRPLRISDLSALDTLSLGSCPIDTRFAHEIGACRFLETLECYSTRLELSEFKAILAAPKLRKVFLMNVAISSAWWQAACASASLDTISLGPTFLTEDAVDALNNARLKGLMLSGCKFSEDALKRFVGPSNVQSLWLTDTNVNDQTVVAISKLSQLKSLNLNSTSTTSHGIAAFRDNSSLHSLELNHTLIDDSAIDSLNSMKKLAILQIASTKISKDGIARLRLPNVWALTVNPEVLDESAVEALRSWEKLDFVSFNGNRAPDGLAAKLRAIRPGFRVQD